MERVELCFHSRFDIKGSVIGTNEIMEIAGQFGTVGVTDYASILGWPELLREKNWRAKDAKLILGCEIPVAFKNGTHMVSFLAKNDLGRQSLCKLVMEAELHHKKKNDITITDEMLLNPEYRDGILLGGYEELICAIEDDAEDDILKILEQLCTEINSLACYIFYLIIVFLIIVFLIVFHSSKHLFFPSYKNLIKLL